MFRRRTQSAPEEPAVTAEPVKPQGKGRPTPKRREAEKRRRQPITAPPRDRKEAYRQVRERQRQERSKVREGMARGEEKYLPRRDKGPVRRMARNFVDARRTFSEFFLYLTLAFFIVSIALPPVLKAYMSLFVWPLMLIVFLLESLSLGFRVTRLARERFPDEDRRFVGVYAAMRALQIRRMRIPQPQVRPGDKDQI